MCMASNNWKTLTQTSAQRIPASHDDEHSNAHVVVVVVDHVAMFSRGLCTLCRLLHMSAMSRPPP